MTIRDSAVILLYRTHLSCASDNSPKDLCRMIFQWQKSIE